MDVLKRICDEKREHARTGEAETPLRALEKKCRTLPATRGFRNRVSDFRERGKPALIAEMKKASPSAGPLRASYDPATIARSYESGGAACLSVLTDSPSFRGCNEDLVAAREACSLPALRKDFMLTPWQIFESRIIGADCILLIVAALTDPEARELNDLALSLGMDVLVEAHDRSELDRALALNPAMIGVNNRDLKTLKTDLDTAFRLVECIPRTVLKVAESGIGKHRDLAALLEAGYDAFLVGESLLKQDDTEKAVRTLLSGS